MTGIISLKQYLGDFFLEKNRQRCLFEKKILVIFHILTRSGNLAETKESFRSTPSQIPAT